MKKIRIFLLMASTFMHAENIRAKDESVEGGQSIYFQKGTCAVCHGDHGRGDGPAAVALEPKPQDFSQPFKYGETTAEILRSISDGRIGTSMVGYRDVLKKKELQSVVNYVVHLKNKLRAKICTERLVGLQKALARNDRLAALSFFSPRIRAILTPRFKDDKIWENYKALWTISIVKLEDYQKDMEFGKASIPFVFEKGQWLIDEQ